MTLTYMNSGGRGRYRTADRWCVKRQDRVNGRSTVSSTSSSGAFPFRPASPCPRCSALSWDTGGSLANGRGCARRRCADCALHSAFPNIDEQPRMPTHWKALLIRVCYPVTDISAVEIRSRVGRWQFRLRCCLSTSQFLPHGASWTWPRGGGWAGGAPCPGAGPCGAGPSCPGAGPCGCGAGRSSCRGGDSGCSARGGGTATDGTSGFAVGGGTSGGGSGVISPMGAGLISAVNTVPCSRDTDRPCPSYSAAKVSSAADSCHAAGVAIKFDVGVSFDESVAAWAPFCMPAVTWCIGSFAMGAHSDRSQVVTGNCAPPTTLEAVLIKAAITAYSACMRRPGIAIILGGAPVMARCCRTPTQPSRRAPDLRVCPKAKW